MPDRRMLVALYVALYLLLTLTDAWSTALGLSAGAREFNHHVSAEGGMAMQWGRFMAINALVLGATAAMFAWALARIERIDPRYLREPWRASLNWLLYLNPFSVRNQPRSVLHYIAGPLGLLAAKAVATANNLLIAHDLPDVVTPIAHAVLAQVDGVAGYWVVIFVVFTPSWVASLYVTAAWLRRAAPRTAPAAITAA
jgi:hypothetical protein